MLSTFFYRFTIPFLLSWCPGRSRERKSLLRSLKKIHLAPRASQKGVESLSRHDWKLHCLIWGLTWCHRISWAARHLLKVNFLWLVRPLQWAVCLHVGQFSALWFQFLFCQMRHLNFSPSVGSHQGVLAEFSTLICSSFSNLSFRVFLGVFPFLWACWVVSVFRVLFF